MDPATLLAAKYDQLPEALQELFTSDDFTPALLSIGQKYGLHVDKVGELVDEVWLVLLGETHTDQFIEHLTARLAVPREKAGQIAADVNEQVFLKVREALKELSSRPKEEPKPEPQPVAPQPSRATVLEGVENPELAALAGDFAPKTSKGPSEEQAEILKSIESPAPTPLREEKNQSTVPPAQVKVAARTAPTTAKTALPEIAGEPGDPYGETILPNIVPGQTAHENPIPIKISVPPTPKTEPTRPLPPVAPPVQAQTATPKTPPPKKAPPPPPAGAADPYREAI